VYLNLFGDYHRHDRSSYSFLPRFQPVEIGSSPLQEPIMSKKTKSKIRSKLVRDLKIISSDFSHIKREYRGGIYEIMGRTMPIVVQLRNDKAALRNFTRIAKIAPKLIGNLNSPAWITNAVMSFVMKVKSKNTRKLAWKRARALDYLYDIKKTPLAKIAKALKKAGGVEKIVRLAGKKNPRRPNNAISEEDPKINSSPGNSPSDATSCIFVKIKGPDLKKVTGLSPNKKVRLIGKRLQKSSSGPMLTITKVVVLKAKQA
jgi:hypothetical protein